MADLYNLDDEIDALQESPELQHVEEEWETEDVEEIILPDSFEEPARRKLQTSDDTNDAAAVVDDLEEEFFSGKSSKEKETQLEALQYTQLYQKWSQELLSPELLPYPEELVEAIKSSLEQAEDHFIETGNANMDALFTSIARIDAERAKFLLADLLKLRLQKIQAHPLYMRSRVDRMSRAEVRDDPFAPSTFYFCATFTLPFPLCPGGIPERIWCSNGTTLDYISAESFSSECMETT
jgi:hypothetical protein